MITVTNDVSIRFRFHRLISASSLLILFPLCLATRSQRRDRRQTPRMESTKSISCVGGYSFPAVVDLNVGGVFYTTSLSILTKYKQCLLDQIFTGKKHIDKDIKGRFFIDRDGHLFQYILDFLRNDKIVLPEKFQQFSRLKTEAEFFNMPKLVEQLTTLEKKENTSKQYYVQPQEIYIPRRRSPRRHIPRPETSNEASYDFGYDVDF